MDGVSLAREYYRSIDEDDYDALAEALSGDFRHCRPDRTVEGRDSFVRFMRSGRPKRGTTHVVDSVYADGRGRVAVEGELLYPDGETWFRFLDVFEIEGNEIERVRTYSAVGSE